MSVSHPFRSGLAVEVLLIEPGVPVIELYPELERDAELRRTNTLCEEEARFVQARKQFIVQSGALKRFLQLEEADDVHPDDVPIIGLGLYLCKHAPA